LLTGVALTDHPSQLTQQLITWTQHNNAALIATHNFVTSIEKTGTWRETALPLGIIGLFLIAVVTLNPTGHKINTRFITEFREHLETTTAHTTQMTQQPAWSTPSPIACMINALITIVCGAIVFLKYEIYRIIGPQIMALFAILITLLIASLISGGFHRRVRNQDTYFRAAIIMTTYAAWPALDTMIYGRINNAPRAITLLAFDALIFLILWAIPKSGPQTTSNNSPQKAQRPQIGIITGLWLLTAYTQISAIIWTITRITTRGPRNAIPETLWIIPIILAHTIIITNAHKKYAKIRPHLQTIQSALVTRVRILSQLLDTTTPRVALIPGNQSYIQRTPMGRPVLCIATRPFHRLTIDQQNALILHELYHVKKHHGITAILETLSVAVLCGRGLLTVLIDPQQFEYDADNAAATALIRDGRQGKRIVRECLYVLSMQGLDNEQITRPPASDPLSVTPSIKEVLFGNAGFWYEHPSIKERISALAEDTA
jgi:Zn-dependent protease with chaperone function